MFYANCFININKIEIGEMSTDANKWMLKAKFQEKPTGGEEDT